MVAPPCVWRAAAPAIPNVKDYAGILADLYVRRSLIRIGEDIVNTAYDAPTEKTSKDQIAEAEKALYAVADRLAQQPASWKPFESQGARRWFYRSGNH